MSTGCRYWQVTVMRPNGAVMTLGVESASERAALEAAWLLLGPEFARSSARVRALPRPGRGRAKRETVSSGESAQV